MHNMHTKAFDIFKVILLTHLNIPSLATFILFARDYVVKLQIVNLKLLADID